MYSYVGLFINITVIPTIRLFLLRLLTASEIVMLQPSECDVIANDVHDIDSDAVRSSVQQQASHLASYNSHTQTLHSVISPRQSDDHKTAS